MPIAHHFLIDTTDFGIGSVVYSTDPVTGTFTLEIVGDETLVTAIRGDNTHPFGWTLYPPKFYVRQAIFTSEGDAKTLNIDEDTLDDYDIALYLIEHNDIFGQLTVSGIGMITFVGIVSINGTDRPLNISCPATLTA